MIALLVLFGATFVISGCIMTAYSIGHAVVYESVHALGAVAGGAAFAGFGVAMLLLEKRRAKKRRLHQKT